MIVTILGGSAFSTPTLVGWLAAQELCPATTIRLAGRSVTELQAVARTCRLLAGNSPIQIEEYLPHRWNHALEAADIVIIQIRVGGFEGRAFDESFSLAYGIPGDEGLGPGGLSCALRSWPTVREILNLVRRSAHRSLPILLTSPGSLLARLAALEMPALSVYSICELPFTTLEEICRVSSKPVEEVAFSYSGVNHLGWFHRVSWEGKDLLEPFIGQQKHSPLYPLMARHHAVPLKYFRLHPNLSRKSSEQDQVLPNPARAQQLAAIKATAIATFAQGDECAIRQVLARRPAPWYSEAIGPLVIQLGLSSPDRFHSRPFFISTADSTGRVEEKAHSLRDSAFHALPMEEPPPAIRAINLQYMAYEEQAAFSLRGPTLEKLTQALATHPWISRKADAAALAGILWNRAQSMQPEDMLCVN